MNNILYYSFFFCIAVIAYAFFETRKKQKKIYFYLGLLIGATIVVGLFIFLMGNLDKKRGMQPGFNFLGLDIILYASIAALLGSGIFASIERKLWPHIFMILLSAVQIVLIFLLKFYLG